MQTKNIKNNQNKQTLTTYELIELKRAKYQFQEAVRRFQRANGPYDWPDDLNPDTVYIFALVDLEEAERQLIENFNLSPEEISALVDAAA